MGFNGDQSTRSKVYQCYIDGFTIDQTYEHLKTTTIKYITSLYSEFHLVMAKKYKSREEQIKYIEAQLFFAMENTKNNQLIQRLQNSYCKFLLY